MTEREIYQVDIEMCGDYLPDDFDLEDFCLELDCACEEKGVDVDIEAVTGSVNGARNDDPNIVPDGLFWDVLCQYCDRLDASREATQPEPTD